MRSSNNPALTRSPALAGVQRRVTTAPDPLEAWLYFEILRLLAILHSD